MPTPGEGASTSERPTAVARRIFPPHPLGSRVPRRSQLWRGTTETAAMVLT